MPRLGQYNHAHAVVQGYHIVLKIVSEKNTQQDDPRSESRAIASQPCSLVYRTLSTHARVEHFGVLTILIQPRLEASRDGLIGFDALAKDH